MKTSISLPLGIILGAVATFYYMALQNTASLSYNDGAVKVMQSVCPALVEKVIPPQPVKK